jgi:tryptophanyl-tRNA synthetase
MSDDETFLFKEGTKDVDLKKFNELTYQNVKDIIACGFKKENTYIFSNLESNTGDLYFNNILIANATTMNTIKATYGMGETVDEPVLKVVMEALEQEKQKENPNIENIRSFEKLIRNNSNNKESNSIGQCVWPVFQCGPAFVTSFRPIFVRAIKRIIEQELPDYVRKNMEKALEELTITGSAQSIMCLVPMGIDQAPYFRMARDVAHVLSHQKPAVIHSEFLPGLQSPKMSSSSNINSTIFLDMDPKKVGDVINKYAFSGGQSTLQEHQKYGGDISVDVCYKYLTYMLDDDTELRTIAIMYSNGTLTTGKLKKITSDIISKILITHQEIKNSITDGEILEFFNPHRTLDIGGCYNKTYDKINEEIYSKHYDYNNYGINFDRSFGRRPISVNPNTQ